MLTVTIRGWVRGNDRCRKFAAAKSVLSSDGGICEIGKLFINLKDILIQGFPEPVSDRRQRRHAFFVIDNI